MNTMAHDGYVEFTENNQQTQATSTSWAGWTISCASWTLQHATGPIIATAACAAISTYAALTQDLNLGGYAPYALGLTPIINSLIQAGLRQDDDAWAIRTKGAVNSAIFTAGTSTALSYSIVNAGHDMGGWQYLLAVGSVGLNTFLNMNSAGQTVESLAHLNQYRHSLNYKESVCLIAATLLSGVLSLAGSTPMMTAVVDATPKVKIPGIPTIPYSLLAGSNNILFFVDSLLLMHPMIMSGLIELGKIIEKSYKKCRGTSAIGEADEKLQNDAHKLLGILNNLDQRQRFMARLQLEKGDITVEKIQKVITEMTEFTNGCMPAAFKMALAILTVGATNLAYTYITAGEITLVGNYKELGFIGEIPKGLLSILDQTKLQDSIGNTNWSALLLNSGNFVFPAVGGYHSLKIIGSFFSDIWYQRNKGMILTGTSIGTNIASLIMGFLSIGTILAMGSGTKIAYAAALSPFLLNTSAAPGKLAALITLILGLISNYSSTARISSASSDEQSAAVAAFNKAIETAEEAFDKARTAKTPTLPEAIAAYSATIKTALTDLATGLKIIYQASGTESASSESLEHSGAAITVDIDTPPKAPLSFKQAGEKTPLLGSGAQSPGFTARSPHN